jgi:hypothetical protein
VKDTYTRITAWLGPVAVALWIGGVVCLTHNAPGDHASDLKILGWYRADANRVLLGGWIFMLGCLAFIGFASGLRRRMLLAENSDSLTTLAFSGAVLGAGFAMLIPLADIAGAIDKSDISPATAATFHHISDAFFVAAEIAAIIPLVAVGMLALQTRIVPRWWAALGLLVAVVLVIGPIGWAGLIFGIPIWTLGTTYFLLRGPREPRRVPATA